MYHVFNDNNIYTYIYNVYKINPYIYKKKCNYQVQYYPVVLAFKQWGKRKEWMAQNNKYKKNAWSKLIYQHHNSLVTPKSQACSF